MKTILYSTCFLDDPGRLERNIRYIKYYDRISRDLEVNQVYLLDNFSTIANINALQEAVKDCRIRTSVQRVPSVTDTAESFRPYCWRGLYWCRYLFDLGWDKIIIADTDGFILTKRLAEYVKNIESGWVSFREIRHLWPESSFQIICRDSQKRLEEFCAQRHWSEWGTYELERAITAQLTLIETEFNFGRWGEVNVPQPPSCDWYGQRSAGQRLVNEWGHILE